MRKWLVALTLSVLTPAAALAQTAPEVLTRNGKWALNEGPDSCALYAQFGEGDDSLIAKFTRYAPDGGFDLALLGKRMAAMKPRSEARLDFGVGGPAKRTVLNGSLGKWDAAFFYGLGFDNRVPKKPGDAGPPNWAQQAAAVTALTVAIERRPPFRLEFGSLAKPFAQLSGCATNLLFRWGYDYAVESRLSRRPTPLNDASQWVTQDDYPDAAVMQGHNGKVQARIDIDAQGAVASCHVLDRTEPDDFADTVCRLIVKRAKVAPALDAAGKPVKSYLMRRWEFRISE